MALSGLDPLLVIILKVSPPEVTVPAVQLSAADKLWQLVGVPIPIYLSEKITGVYVDTESKGIDVITRVEPQKKGLTDHVTPPPIVSQTSADSQLTINLFAKKGSIMLTALLVLMDMVVDRLVSQEYSIHYLNGPTAIFGAKLHRFANSSSPGSELVNIELVLSTAAKELPTPAAKPAESLKNTATIPSV